MDLLREAVEFKKLNNNLMKVTMFEDLIADIYARLYEENRHRFIEQANEENRGRMKVDHLLMSTDGAADVPTPPTSAPTSEAPVPRGRTKGISRRDIQRRAEAIVSHHARPVINKMAATPVDEDKLPLAPVVRVPTLNSIRGLTTDSISVAQDSVPTSLQESADDESELSEIDDEKLAKMKAEQNIMFPNLKSGKSSELVSDLSAAISLDGDGDENMVPDDENNEVDREDDMEGETGLAEEGEEGDTDLQVAATDLNVDDVADQEDLDMDANRADMEGGEVDGDIDGDGDVKTEETGDETMMTADEIDETEDEAIIAKEKYDGGAEEGEEAAENEVATFDEVETPDIEASGEIVQHGQETNAADET